MRLRRKSIKMFDHEHRFLQEAYLRRGFTIEHYEVRKDELKDLCDEWRAHFGRSDSDEELLHYMRTKRKRGMWVRFDGAHKPAPELPKLSAEHKEVLVDIFYEHLADLGSGSDNLAYELETAAMVATEFEHRTDLRIPAPQLIGTLTKLRKRGLLPKVRPQAEMEMGDHGFEDIDEVG